MEDSTNHEAAAAEKRRAYAREYARKRRLEDPAFVERQRIASKKSFEKNKEERKKTSLEWKAKNKEAVAEYNKKYKAEHQRKPRKYEPIQAKKQRDAWKSANPEWHTEYNRKYTQGRYKSDPVFTLKMRERNRIRQGFHVRGLSKKGPSTEMLGCSWVEFFQHIESLFVDGMSWANMSEWHVDHIKPLALFDLSDPEQQKIAFHYKNHQPLWAIDNLKKGARYV